MSILVAHSSEHGSTNAIAARIGQRLQDGGFEVESRAADATIDIDLAGFDAIVVGSAIHSGAWLPAAAALVDRCAATIPHRPVWLFSVSSVGDTSSVFGNGISRLMRKARPEPKQIAAFRQRLAVGGHRSFAGVVRRADWGLTGDLFVRLLRGRYGDHRDWTDIDHWADGIAAALSRADAEAQLVCGRRAAAEAKR